MMTHPEGGIARADAEIADVVRRQVRAGRDAGAADREIRYTALHDYYTTLAVEFPFGPERDGRWERYCVALDAALREDA
ncbi:MAG: hypothetical protein JO116_00965 [Planctomycetaceae bacterium]|nr:hypothetical protein [Planctomycetaceae bacterium]